MENFYLKAVEDFSSVLDKIKLSQDNDISLIIPSGQQVFKSIINLRILKEESSVLGKNVFIITSDQLIKNLSQQAGLMILSKPVDIQEEFHNKKVVDLRFKKKIPDVFIPEEPVKKDDLFAETESFFRDTSEKESIFSEPLPLEKIKEPGTRKKIKIFRPKLFLFLGIIIILAAIVIIINFVLPSMKAVLTPKTEAVNFEIGISIDKNIDSINLEQNKVPGQLFQSENSESRKFPTTGEKQIEEKATGKIIVYNQFSSSPQTLVKTTRFKSPDGKIFRLTETTTIPGATIDEGKIIPSTKEVNVVADEAGEAYNIGPTNGFKIPGFEGSPKYEAFYGNSTEAMKGGVKGKVRVASKQDIEGAIEIVSLELEDKTFKDFQEEVPDNLMLLENSQKTEIIEKSSSLKIDQAGEEFTIFVKAKSIGLAFKEGDVRSLIENNLKNEALENKVLIPSSIKIDYGESELDLDNGKVGYNCKVSANAAWNVDQDKIKNYLAGKSDSDVKNYFSSMPEIKEAKLVYWPFWIKKVPSNKNRIRIVIKLD